MTREQKVAKAQRFRAEGWKLREIAEEMGYAISSVNAWLTDPDRSKEIARKESYSGTCEECGCPTTGTNGREKAPTRCIICVHERNAERNKEIFERNADGQPHWLIAEEMGISETNVSSLLNYHRRRKGRDIPMHRLGGGFAEREARREQIVALRRDGFTNAEIAKLTGFSSTASLGIALQRMRKNGWDIPPATRKVAA